MLSRSKGGAVAAMIRERYKNKVTTKHIVELFQIHFHAKPEWHYSGFFKTKTSRGAIKVMGRTWLFTDEEANYLLEHYEELEAEYRLSVEMEEKRLQSEVYGFYYEWKEDEEHPKRDRYGRPKDEYYRCKVLHPYKGLLKDAPRNFTECQTEEQYKRVVAADGKKYLGYSSPSLGDFWFD